MKLILPFPPTVNTYWRRHGNTIHLSIKGKLYANKVMALLGPQKPLGQRLKVILHLYPPDHRKRDIDNYAKATLDCLTKCQVYNDDSQIDILEIHRCEVIKDGKLIVEIIPL